MRILYIGNKFYKYLKVKSVLETLEDLLVEFVDIKTCSDKKNKFLRLLDMLLHFFRYGIFYDKIIIDVYSTTAIYFAYIFSTLSLLFNKKYILFLHGGNLPNRYKASPNIIKFIFSNAEKIISPSSYLYLFFKKHGYEIVIIPNIINYEKYPYLHRNNARPKILSLRGFSYIYNPMMTLKAIKILKPDYPKIELLMLGSTDGKDFNEINTFIKDNELEKNVLIKNKMPLKEWIELSKHYDIMISNPIIDNTPVSLIEGMALGMCIISTNVGGVSHFVGNNNCILIENNNAIQLAKKITGVIENPAIASNLSISGRKKSEEFSWNNVKNLWKSILIK